jgi:Fe-S cluster biogenesis protein NfuA
MSANNWAVCPRCARTRASELADRAEKVRAMYGTESLEEFDRARTELATDQVKPLDATFRENYEIYGAESGVVHITYGGGCSVCGLSLTFKHELALDVDGPAAHVCKCPTGRCACGGAA